jgi:hypothetical protein
MSAGTFVLLTVVFSAAAIAGTVRGSIEGPEPGTRLSVLKDDGTSAGYLVVSTTRHYSISLPAGRYKVQCPSTGGRESPGVYLFALEGPNTVNLQLHC